MSYDATRRRLDALTDHVGFQDLVTILLTRTGVNVRPLGGPGDRGRDAVAGLYRAKGGEPLAVTISLERDWRAKIRADLKRIHDCGFRPKTVISVTNRLAAAPAQEALQAQVKKQYGVDLTIHEQRWLVMQLHRRDNLDLLGEYLHLPPPRPRFFLDLSEFEHLLEGRGLLAAPFAGRREELDEVERLLADQGRAVIIEAPGGYGKTRLAVELARSGRPSTWWFLVDYGLAYVKGQATAGHYIHPHLEELEPLLHARRRRAAAKRELNRLLDEFEAGASGGYRLGLEDAVRWLGIDSSELTHRINQWARAGGGKLDLAFTFLASASWPVFTERAYALLDARPNDPQVREALLRGRDPFSSFGFIGDLEPTYRAAADEYRRWTHSRDRRLREFGQEAVALYERRPANKRRTNDASESACRLSAWQGGCRWSQEAAVPRVPGR